MKITVLGVGGMGSRFADDQGQVPLGPVLPDPAMDPVGGKAPGGTHAAGNAVDCGIHCVHSLHVYTH